MRQSITECFLILAPNKYNISLWFWELPKFPPEWEFAFEFFDEIWAASKYTAESIATVSPVPVVTIPLCLELPNVSLTRDDLNLPKDQFIFLFIFDFGSSFQRKNPFAAIQAFKQAFGHIDRDVTLVIKFANAHHYPQHREELNNLVADLPNVILIEGHIPKAEVYGLIANCDCYVSLHRAEGFGLTMAEAMYYGKPVIATAYSSNLDFMNVGNSFLVSYDLIETTEDYGAYPKGSIWADADVDHAAYLMRYVYDNYQESKQVGEKAARDIKTSLSPQTVGKKIKNRLEYIMTQKSRLHRGTRGSQQLLELQTERDWWSSQSNAWRQTAQKIKQELVRSRT